MEKKKIISGRRGSKDANQIAKNIVDSISGDNQNSTEDDIQENYEKYFEGKPLTKITAELLRVPISGLKGI